MDLVLRSEVLEEIKSNPSIYGQVAEALKITPMSLPRLLYDNSPKLTQANVLKILRLELKKQDSELLEEKTIEA